MPQPVAFLSYVWLDDQYENGRLTEFCRRLSGEVRLQTGQTFEIFQDRNDVGWGEQWQQRIEESLDAVTFFIPIMTPGFFRSPNCRAEFERFLEREKQLGRGDLILPVYYVNCPILNDETRREADSLAKTIAGRQYADWRELRFEPFTSPQIGKTISRMAEQIVRSLERGGPARPAAAKATGRETGPEGATPTELKSAEGATEISQTARGPAGKTEPRTRVVDPLYRGDHLTLTEALRAAEPGDRILIRPGFYKEGVVIDKPVEIIGDGDLNEVIIEASGKDTVLFRANMARIANLTLRQTGGGNWYCVDIAQGRLDLEGCDISSQSLSCVAIHDGADPRLRRNRIHDGAEAGVFIYANGQGTLEDNDIVANALASVAIKEGGNPALRRNRIHDGKGVGVFVYENGQGTLEENDIFANATTGVVIKEGGNPTVRRNRISENGYEAIWVYEGGRGIFEDNDLRGNKRGAWDIAAECEANVTRDRNQE